MLKILEKERKVQSWDEVVGKRARKMYEITQAGKDEFADWMGLPAESGSHRDELLLKLFFGANIKKDEIIKQLRMKLQQCQKKRAEFTIIEIDTFTQIPDEYPHKIFWKMTLKNGIAQVDTKIKWIKDCLQILENRIEG